jgi:hypothetical protein
MSEWIWMWVLLAAWEAGQAGIIVAQWWTARRRLLRS